MGVTSRQAANLPGWRETLGTWLDDLLELSPFHGPPKPIKNNIDDVPVTRPVGLSLSKGLVLFAFRTHSVCRCRYGRMAADLDTGTKWGYLPFATIHSEPQELKCRSIFRRLGWLNERTVWDSRLSTNQGNENERQIAKEDPVQVTKLTALHFQSLR
jgi:hypothetical protein